MLSSHLRLGVPSGHFPSIFPTEIMYASHLPLVSNVLNISSSKFEVTRYGAQSFLRSYIVHSAT